jgi:hypothetical protein
MFYTFYPLHISQFIHAETFSADYFAIFMAVFLFLGFLLLVELTPAVEKI